MIDQVPERAREYKEPGNAVPEKRIVPAVKYKKDNGAQCDKKTENGRGWSGTENKSVIENKTKFHKTSVLTDQVDLIPAVISGL